MDLQQLYMREADGSKGSFITSLPAHQSFLLNTVKEHGWNVKTETQQQTNGITFKLWINITLNWIQLNDTQAQYTGRENTACIDKCCLICRMWG